MIHYNRDGSITCIDSDDPSRVLQIKAGDKQADAKIAAFHPVEAPEASPAAKDAAALLVAAGVLTAAEADTALAAVADG